MKRKTIKVDELIQRINAKLILNLSQVAKVALCNLLEDVLHSTGNYHGYQNLYWMTTEGHDKWLADGQPEFPEKEKYISNDKSEEYSRFYYGDTYPTKEALAAYLSEIYKI